MAELRIYLDIDLYNSFIKEEITLEYFLTEAFNDGGNPMDEFDEGSKGDIIAELLSYHSDEGGSPQCDEFTITDANYNEFTKTGSVEVSYNISYHFTCSDMNSDYDSHENVKFEIDLENEELMLHFPNYEPRTTNNEF